MEDEDYFTASAKYGTDYLTYTLTVLSNCLATCGQDAEALSSAKEATWVYTANTHNICGASFFLLREQELGRRCSTPSLRLATFGQLKEALLNTKKATDLYHELSPKFKFNIVALGAARCGAWGGKMRQLQPWRKVAIGYRVGLYDQRLGRSRWKIFWRAQFSSLDKGEVTMITDPSHSAATKDSNVQDLLPHFTEPRPTGFLPVVTEKTFLGKYAPTSDMSTCKTVTQGTRCTASVIANHTQTAWSASSRHHLK
ncbi:hypothetical protein B0H17DRAFT_1129356 [Mycena rosella]|uniref:Uncharacterized protein n=1 Tax=Mycena rosella TaxID=1033263 RepID=A0AAD7DUJ2_MYCRO|nr:hypothetical protein B0H17DRAFT_1129356 [Mycena rosella]